MNLLASLIVIPLLTLTWLFTLLAVNTDDPRSQDNIHLAFHYLLAFVCFLLAVFLLLGHVVLNPRTRYELKRCWSIFRGDKDGELDESGARNGNTLSRSALAYHQDAVDPMSRFNMAISTTSTTSHSTSKTSSGGYRADHKGRSMTTTSSQPSDYQNPGYDSSYFHDKGLRVDDPDTGEISRTKKKVGDSDSESDLSLGEASLELASSHSSDDDEDYMGWADVSAPKNKTIERVKAQTKPKLPPGGLKVKPKPGADSKTPDGSYNDAYSHSTTSESEGRDKVSVIEKPRPAPRQSLGPAPGGPPLGPAPMVPRPALANRDELMDSAASQRGSLEMLNESSRQLDSTVSNINRTRESALPPVRRYNIAPPAYQVASINPPAYEMAMRDSSRLPPQGHLPGQGQGQGQRSVNRSFSSLGDSRLAPPYGKEKNYVGVDVKSLGGPQSGPPGPPPSVSVKPERTPDRDLKVFPLAGLSSDLPDDESRV